MKEQTDLHNPLSALDRVRDPFISVDLHWRISYINRAALRMLASGQAFIPEYVSGRDLWALCPILSSTRFEEEFKRAMKEQCHYRFEAALPNFNGRLETHLYPSSDGLSIIVHDITDRQNEKALLREEAEQAIRARENTIAVVSHDLRNPVNTIGLCIHYMLRNRYQDNRIENNLRIIKRATDQMERLVKDLLDLRSLEAGQVLPIAPRAVFPSVLITEACESMEPLLNEKSLRLERQISPFLPEVIADPDQMERVLMNLLGNALKFTPSGGGICIGAKQILQEVRFHVRDTGVGIPEAHLSRIFEPFWQGERTPGSGIGLGLAIVKGIVEGHGGRAWAESLPGKGAAFYFTLPIVNSNGNCRGGL
jgi:signal transduction histidine kinase